MRISQRFYGAAFCRLLYVSRLRRLAIAIVGVASLMGTSAAHAAETSCQASVAEIFCNARVETTQLTQNDIDTGAAILDSAPWVIGGTTTISLPAGQTYTPGNSSVLGWPAIWVIGDAVLEIDGHGATPVGIASNIYLCDNATFRVRNATYRNEQDPSNSYWLWAAGNSQLEYENATIATNTGGYNIDAFQALRGTAALSAPGGGAADFSVTGGSFEVALADAATASIDGASGIMSFYLARNAGLTLANSSYARMSTTTCAGETHTLSNIPPACSLSGSECFRPTHPLTDFDRPAAPAIDIDQSRVYTWLVETLPGSTTNLSTIPTDANLVVMLGGDLGTQVLTLAPGIAPVGITDRTIALTSANILSWALNPTANSDVTITPGSEIGDLLAGQDSLLTANDVTFRQGKFNLRFDSEVRLFDSLVDSPVQNLDGVLQAVDTTFLQQVSLDGETWLADSVFTQAPLFFGAGVLYEVSLNQPVSGAYAAGAPIEIRGSVTLTDPFARPGAASDAVVELYDVALDTTTQLATLTGNLTDQLLATLDTTGLAPGDYEIRLRFENTTVAVATRSISLGAPVPSLSHPALMAVAALCILLGKVALSLLRPRERAFTTGD